MAGQGADVSGSHGSIRSPMTCDPAVQHSAGKSWLAAFRSEVRVSSVLANSALLSSSELINRDELELDVRKRFHPPHRTEVAIAEGEESTVDTQPGSIDLRDRR